MFNTLYLIAWFSLIIGNPYIMSSFFVVFLLIMACTVGTYCNFLGFIIVLIYVGGIMVLMSYCVILLPTNKFNSFPLPFYPLILSIPIVGGFDRVFNSYAYGLLYSWSAIIIIGLLLYLVMVAVVDIVDYSSGMIYVRCEIFLHNKIDLDYINFKFICAELS